ncbi:MAG TPA: hypothetical protein VHU18_07110 [Rhizomicrobium sp.]|jgi:hypothetical protein|nr:hypothetical protein [Rhizomicrobium sp.]
MPRNVRWFGWLWVASFLLAFPELLLMPAPDAEATTLGVTRSTEIKLGIGALLLLMAILFPFFRLAVWKRKNWARWVLFAIFVLSLPLLFVDHAFRADTLPLTIYGFVGTLMEAAAFYFLFTGDARAWFQSQTAK